MVPASLVPILLAALFRAGAACAPMIPTEAPTEVIRAVEEDATLPSSDPVSGPNDANDSEEIATHLHAGHSHLALASREADSEAQSVPGDCVSDDSESRILDGVPSRLLRPPRA